MAKINKKFLAAIIFVAGFIVFNFPISANAMTPTLTLSATGSGDNVQINVIGDPNVSVLLFSALQTVVLGNTNSSGNFSTTVSSATVVPNGITSNAIVYVKTNGLSGSQSQSVSWPYVNSSSSSGNFTLSQLALLLNAGQTSTITASVSSLYLLSNSVPGIANINFNANQITVQALTYGSTTANICVVGSTTNCQNLAITVQSSGVQQLNFSQNNFSIVNGQSVSVTVSGGSGYYTISNNSNSSAIQTGLNGSVVTLTATSTTGAASITVCTTDNANCGIINVSSTALNSNAITFSQTNPVVPLGQSTTVTIYGGTGTNFYVSSNSNPSIVQANINSNILTLIGNSNTGTSTISVCAYAGTCGSITANVSSVSTGGNLMLSQSTVSILAGQSSTITISGGSTPYSVSSSGSSNIFNTNISGNILTVYGVNPGSATASVCSSTGCTNLYITIQNINSSVNSPTLSQNNIMTNVGQQTTIYVSGNGGYYVSNNANPNVASAQINGTSLVVSATQSGSDNISICQNGGQCVNLYLTVSGTTAQLVLNQTNLSLTVGQSSTVSISGNGGYYISTNSSSGVASAAISGSSLIVSAISVGTDNISICQAGGQCTNIYVAVTGNSPAVATNNFSRYLGFGDRGDDVLQLQEFLSNEGFLTATPNGHYGPATVSAIKKFQSNHGIRQTGSVGPSTLSALNRILSTTSTSLPPSTSTSAIQAQIQQLLAQISQMQGH